MSDYIPMAKRAAKYLVLPVLTGILAVTLRRGPRQVDEHTYMLDCSSQRIAVDPRTVSLVEGGEIHRLVDLLLPATPAVPLEPVTEAGAEGPAQAGGLHHSKMPSKGDRDDDEKEVNEQYVNAGSELHASTAATSQAAVAGDEDLGDEEAATATVADERIPDAERLRTFDAMVYGSGASFNDSAFDASLAEVEYDQFIDDILVLERVDDTQDMTQTDRHLERVTAEGVCTISSSGLALNRYVDDEDGETA